MYEELAERRDENVIKIGLESLARASQDPIFWHNIGTGFYNLKLYELSIYAWQKAIDLKPDCWITYLSQSAAFHMKENLKAGFERFEYRHSYFSCNARNRWQG